MSGKLGRGGREKRNAWAVWGSIVVGLLMATSIIGLVFVNYGGSSETLKYGKYKFERQADGSLITKVNNKPVSFTYFPGEIEYITLNQSAVELLKGTRMLYVTSDYQGNFSQVVAAAEFDFSKALYEHYGIFVVQGFFQNVSSFPVVRCANATPFVPVVSFEEGAENEGFRESGSCLVADADSYEGFVKLRDRLLYGFLGVIDGSKK